MRELVSAQVPGDFLHQNAPEPRHRHENSPSPNGSFGSGKHAKVPSAGRECANPIGGQPDEVVLGREDPALQTPDQVRPRSRADRAKL